MVIDFEENLMKWRTNAQKNEKLGLQAFILELSYCLILNLYYPSWIFVAFFLALPNYHPGCSLPYPTALSNFCSWSWLPHLPVLPNSHLGFLLFYPATPPNSYLTAPPNTRFRFPLLPCCMPVLSCSVSLCLRFKYVLSNKP